MFRYNTDASRIPMTAALRFGFRFEITERLSNVKEKKGSGTNHGGVPGWEELQ